MILKEIGAKKILTESNLPESDYCINPYVGCMHGCIYCYARFMRRFTGHRERWGDFVDVKINAESILRKDIKKAHRKGAVLIGSVTDAYQPLERKYEITRGILSALVEAKLHVSILTKSDLVLRDIDLLKQLDNCSVGLTINTLDERFRQNFEPKASPISDRLDALRVLCDNGISTYVFIGPIMPHFTELEPIYEKISKLTDSVWAEALNIRCGNWNDIEETIRLHYPAILTNYKANINDSSYWMKIEKDVRDLSNQYGIPLIGFYRH